MYLHMLGKEEQKLFATLAMLLKYSDDELLWEGKTIDEVTSKTNFEDISFIPSEGEKSILDRYLFELDKLDEDDKNFWNIGDLFSNYFSFSQFPMDIRYRNFVQYLSEYPIHKQNDLEIRIEVIDKIFDETFEDEIKSLELSPSSAKIIIYELQILSLADNQVSKTEQNIIDRLSSIFNFDDYIKEELLECAIETSKQVTKTLSLILE